MLVPRIVSMLALAAGLVISAPASAQFFLKPPNLATGPVTGAEPGMTGPALPGASPAELRAALVWNLRAALNVAALQCEFEPTLLTRDNYNAIIKDHAIELNESLGTIEKYFTRTNSNKKVAQTEFDKYGTRVYSGFSTVSGQLSFCQTAAAIGQDGLFARRGDFGDVAKLRMGELRASLRPWGEQFRRSAAIQIQGERIPPFSDDRCWRRGVYQAQRCGALSVATR